MCHAAFIKVMFLISLTKTSGRNLIQHEFSFIQRMCVSATPSAIPFFSGSDLDWYIYVSYMKNEIFGEKILVINVEDKDHFSTNKGLKLLEAVGSS